nr:AncX [synthetic construct]
MQTCEELLQEFRQNKQVSKAEKLKFTGVDGRDVYNITAPFLYEGKQLILGRVEKRDSEFSEVVFFEKTDGVWTRREDAKTFNLQDPFFTFINGELIFGGVEVFYNPNGAVTWYTVFYRGKDINDLKPFATGPQGMKDIRLVELPDGRIGVFTRPQGEKGGRGKIGFTIINSLDDLTPETIENAPLLPDQFVDEEWGGANEAHLLDNGTIGVLGHIAYFDEDGNRHYYAMCFALDPETQEATPMKIIAVRSNFPEGPAKRPDLADVVFSGGLVRKEDGTAELYVGVSDAEAHRITIPDPFLEYEKQNLEMTALEHHHHHH